MYGPRQVRECVKSVMDGTDIRSFISDWGKLGAYLESLFICFCEVCGLHFSSPVMRLPFRSFYYSVLLHEEELGILESRLKWDGKVREDWMSDGRMDDCSICLQA
jgi:hypothetical protein